MINAKLYHYHSWCPMKCSVICKKKWKQCKTPEMCSSESSYLKLFWKQHIILLFVQSLSVSTCPSYALLHEACEESDTFGKVVHDVALWFWSSFLFFSVKPHTELHMTKFYFTLLEYLKRAKEDRLHIQHMAISKKRNAINYLWWMNYRVGLMFYSFQTHIFLKKNLGVSYHSYSKFDIRSFCALAFGQTEFLKATDTAVQSCFWQKLNCATKGKWSCKNKACWKEPNILQSFLHGM